MRYTEPARSSVRNVGPGEMGVYRARRETTGRSVNVVNVVVVVAGVPWCNWDALARSGVVGVGVEEPARSAAQRRGIGN